MELPTPQRKLMESMHAHWAGLTFFVSHPAIPMDNNQAERYIRLPVVGRKNYLGHQTPGLSLSKPNAQARWGRSCIPSSSPANSTESRPSIFSSAISRLALKVTLHPQI
jgi:hypothetical protein